MLGAASRVLYYWGQAGSGIAPGRNAMSGLPEERRAHKRQQLACPVSLFSRGGQALAQGNTVNISDGGALVSVPGGSAPEADAEINLTLSVPRATASTYMLEEFATAGRVIRRRQLDDGQTAGLAVHFRKPLGLALEV